MNFSNTQLNQLSQLALQAVNSAADYINAFDKTTLKTQFKPSGSSRSAQVVTDVDRHCEQLIIDKLQASCKQFDIALLSEEASAEINLEQHPRFDKDYFWCIDPLDGTLPFIEGREGYAISIALVDKEGVPILTAINLPATNTTYHIQFDDNGNKTVFKNGELFNPAITMQSKILTLYCDQSFITSIQYQRLIKKLQRLLPLLNLNEIVMVSGHGAVVNALSILENNPACYIKPPKPQQGGGALWDFSGTACITHALDAWVSDIHGAPLALNQAESYYMNKDGVIYASSATLGQAIVALLSR